MTKRVLYDANRVTDHMSSKGRGSFQFAWFCLCICLAIILCCNIPVAGNQVPSVKGSEFTASGINNMDEPDNLSDRHQTGLIMPSPDKSSIIQTISGAETAGVSGGNKTDLTLSWQRPLGGSDFDAIWTVRETSDHGFIAGGYSYSDDGDVTGNHGNDDAWIVKLDSSGNKVWQKCLGGSDYDSARATIPTSDGGYLVAGFTASNDGNVSGNIGYEDFWAVKLDAAGNQIWQRCYGGTDSDLARSAIQTSDGGYLLGGYTWSNDANVSGNHGLTDGWVIKLDSSGNISWQKCIGGSSSDYTESVIQTRDGGYLVGGYTDSNDANVTGNHGESDVLITKLDAGGNTTWQRCYGGLSYDFGESVIQTRDGGYLVGGYTDSNDANVTGNHGESDIWILKLDSSGNITWQKCLGGLSSESSYSVIQTADGGYLTSGSTWSDDANVTGNHGYSDIWTVKLDEGGNISWQKCLGGSDYDSTYSVIQADDGRYLIGGYTGSDDGDVTLNHGSYDYWPVLLTATHPVNATSDSWTIAYPPGTTSYVEGTNATYLAEVKPGADLINVSVDSEQVGPLSNWTFSTISGNHTFSTIGQPTHGQIHAFFTLNTTWGQVPLTVRFTNQSLGNPTTFKWDFGDGDSSSDENPVHTYTTPGTYAVTLRAFNGWTGGMATLNRAVTVTTGVVPSPTPTPVPGQITAALSADQTSGNAPMQVLFTDKSTGNPTSWLWDLGDGNISALQNVTHVYATKGTYSVRLTALNSLSSGSVEKSGCISVT